MEKPCINCTHKLKFMHMQLCDRPGLKRPRMAIFERTDPTDKSARVTCGEKRIFWEAKK